MVVHNCVSSIIDTKAVEDWNAQNDAEPQNNAILRVVLREMGNSFGNLVEKVESRQVSDS